MFLKISQISQENILFESNCSNFADLIFFTKKRHRCLPLKFARFLRTSVFYKTPLVAAFLRLSGRSMLCELNWYVYRLWHKYFLMNFEKFLKIMLISSDGCSILSQGTKHQNTLWQLPAMGSLLDDKYRQWGNRFLLITEAYLEPSRKSTTRVFCKILNG